MVEARIPNPKGPLVDKETGVITREWWRFFVSQFDRVGGEGDVSLQVAGDDLTAIEALTGTSGLHRIATNTWALRTLTRSGDGIVITNGDGVSGNPTVAVDADLEGLVDLNGSGGLMTHTAANTWAERTIAAATTTPGAVGLSISDGDGVAGDPTISITTSATNSITSGTTQTQVGATALTTSFNRVTTHANTNDGVKLPTAAAGLRITILNDTATAELNVWPATSDAIEAGAVDAVGVREPGAGVAFVYEAVDATTWYITNEFTTS